MALHSPTGTRGMRGRFVPGLEAMEERSLLAAAIQGDLLDPLLVPKFVNPLPQPLDPSFVYQPTIKPDGTPHYEVGAYQIQEDLGLGLKDARVTRSRRRSTATGPRPTRRPTPGRPSWSRRISRSRCTGPTAC